MILSRARTYFEKVAQIRQGEPDHSTKLKVLGAALGGSALAWWGNEMANRLPEMPDLQKYVHYLAKGYQAAKASIPAALGLGGATLGWYTASSLS